MYWWVFRSRLGVRSLWFGSQFVSLKRNNSMSILALARIPVQMEFLVGTGRFRNKEKSTALIARMPLTLRRVKINR